MVFDNFINPKQINDIEIESLTQFVDLISTRSKLYLELIEEYRNYEENLYHNLRLKSYQSIISNYEDYLKYLFSQSISLNANKSKSSKRKFRVFYRGISNCLYEPIPSIYRNNMLQYEDVFINDIRVYNPDFVENKTFIDELAHCNIMVAQQGFLILQATLLSLCILPVMAYSIIKTPMVV